MSLPPGMLTARRRKSGARAIRIVASAILAAATCLSLSVISGPAAHAAVCGAADIALHQPATASSIQGLAWPASNATDGNLSTRWSSAFSDPQWLEADLGSAQSICQ
ncbi:MAG TPA: discoidin domain-containing protein, partial [Streptosporangiaceae bacterium]|nr:discoidin domain-containing protein [Streptosporangiaceae bacterium]